MDGFEIHTDLMVRVVTRFGLNYIQMESSSAQIYIYIHNFSMWFIFIFKASFLPLLDIYLFNFWEKLCKVLGDFINNSIILNISRRKVFVGKRQRKKNFLYGDRHKDIMDQKQKNPKVIDFLIKMKQK